MDLDSVSVHEHAKKNLANIQPSWPIIHTGRSTVTYHSPSEEEVVFVHVELPSSFKNLGTHLEREQQLMTLKQTAAGVPEEKSHLWNNYAHCDKSIVVHYFSVRPQDHDQAIYDDFTWCYGSQKAPSHSPSVTSLSACSFSAIPAAVRLFQPCILCKHFPFLWSFTFLHFLLFQKMCMQPWVKTHYSWCTLNVFNFTHVVDSLGCASWVHNILTTVMTRTRCR